MVILLFIVILAVLILAHEFGHFIVAKLSGVKVEEFGLGFPPRIFGIKRGETLYSINWIPFGGFVRIFGEDSTDAEPRSFASRPIYLRAAILVAGAFFNLLLAWFLFSLVYVIGAPAPVEVGTEGSYVTILETQAGTPAEKAGLMSGDKIIKLSYVSEGGGEEFGIREVEDVQNFIKKYEGEEITIEYLRGKEYFSANAVPVSNPPEGIGSLGISMASIGIVSLPPHKAVWEGLKDTIFLLGLILQAFWQLISGLFTGANQMAGQVMGPVGIVSMAGVISQLGLVYILQFAALLSAHLAILNLIPFPALDGGRLFFLFVEAIVEAIKGSPMNPKVFRFFNTAGFLILLLLIVLVTYRDIVKLFG